ncbi:ABC transporter ATP-binding protein [Leucobacter chinensis]|uniref:ABC transporter ATP-binding protein n=1 Tax=Leucobacter chinensis TaxID=2851010 RepID=UPI001C21A60F|nr:ABC transporter ATP-binding protein [Leucobacter chinensis]
MHDHAPRSAPEQSAPEQSVPEKRSLENPAPEQSAPEHPGTEHQRVTFFELAAPVRGRVIASGVLAAFGAVSGIIPVLFAMRLSALLFAMRLSALLLAGGGFANAATAAGTATVTATVTATAAGTATGTATAAVSTSEVVWLVALLIVSVAAAQALTMIGYGLSHTADARLSEHLRQRQITQSLRLPLDWFSREGSGRVKKVVQDDVTKVHQLIAHVVPDTVNGVVRPLASLALLFVLDWRIGLIALIPLGLAMASMPLMMKDLSQRYEWYNEALAELNAAMVEFVRGIAPIKIFEASNRGPQRFQTSAVAHHDRYREWMEQTVYGSALIMVFTSPAFAIATAALGTGALVLFAGLSPVLLLPSVLLAANIAGPLYMLAQMRQFMREASGSAQNIADFFSLPAAPVGDPELAMQGVRTEIEGVSFTYPDGPTALREVTETLAPGTVTALVGPSGSGKSTLATLVPRLIDPDSGSIRLGGADSARLTAEALYRNVAFVFQQPYLLRMSVRDNIRIARPDSSDEAVEAAARVAQIHERITRLPEGYDTVVGEGARLSGGEKQRLSIARAVLTDAPLLVLDEATAFADPDSEAEIQRALASLTRGRTLLVVAHRLHTITGADQILVLDGGRVVERGTHEGLIAHGGLYERMWNAYEEGRRYGVRAGAAIEHDQGALIAPVIAPEGVQNA